MKNLRNLVILGAAALSLTGCAWHNTGPCFGVGCPTWASATAPTAKTAANVPAMPAANQTASAAAAQPASGTVAPAPAEKSSKPGFFARVKSVFSPHSKSTASNSASAPAGSSNGR